MIVPTVSEHCSPLDLEAFAHDAELTFAEAEGLREPVFESDPPIAPAYATIKDLCQVLNVSKATVNRLCKRGLPFTLVGCRKRFDLSVVRRWLDEGSIPNNSHGRAKQRVSTNELRSFGFERRSA